MLDQVIDFSRFGLYSVVVITSDSDLKNHNFREPRFDPGYDLFLSFFLFNIYYMYQHSSFPIPEHYIE